jgi:hypothetical protein
MKRDPNMDLGAQDDLRVTCGCPTGCMISTAVEVDKKARFNTSVG